MSTCCSSSSFCHSCFLFVVSFTIYPLYLLHFHGHLSLLLYCSFPFFSTCRRCWTFWRRVRQTSLSTPSFTQPALWTSNITVLPSHLAGGAVSPQTNTSAVTQTWEITDINIFISAFDLFLLSGNIQYLNLSKLVSNETGLCCITVKLNYSTSILIHITIHINFQSINAKYNFFFLNLRNNMQLIEFWSKWSCFYFILL